jgi:hypothetical protein
MYSKHSSRSDGSRSQTNHYNCGIRVCWHQHLFSNRARDCNFISRGQITWNIDGVSFNYFASSLNYNSEDFSKRFWVQIYTIIYSPRFACIQSYELQTVPSQTWTTELSTKNVHWLLLLLWHGIKAYTGNLSRHPLLPPLYHWCRSAFWHRAIPER